MQKTMLRNRVKLRERVCSLKRRENAPILHTRFATFPQEIDLKGIQKGLDWFDSSWVQARWCSVAEKWETNKLIEILKLALLIRFSRISQVTWQQHKCIQHSWVVSTTLCVEVTRLAMVKGSLSGEYCILQHNISDCDYCKMSTVCQRNLLTVI